MALAAAALHGKGSEDRRTHVAADPVVAVVPDRREVVEGVGVVPEQLPAGRHVGLEDRAFRIRLQPEEERGLEDMGQGGLALM